MKESFYQRKMLTTLYNMEFNKKTWSLDDIFTILHTTKVRIYCLMMMPADVGS
jgi:hypothetical protein